MLYRSVYIPHFTYIQYSCMVRSHSLLFIFELPIVLQLFNSEPDCIFCGFLCYI
jgi:hypothetical protein